MKHLYDWTKESAIWIVNASYNILVNIPETLWNTIPISTTNTPQQSHDEQEILLAQDSIQNSLPLNERKSVVEAHNAYAIKNDIAASNQILPLNKQLDTAIPTVVELDIHPDGSGDVRLCHGDSSNICLTPKLTFEEALKTIHDHAKQHPDRVFIINLEDRSLVRNDAPNSTFDVVAPKIEAILGNRLWCAGDTKTYCTTTYPRTCSAFPTPNDMLSSGKNIALTSQCHRGSSTLYVNSNEKQIAFQLNALLGNWLEYGIIDSEMCKINGKQIANTRITEDGMFIKLGQQTLDTENLAHAKKCGASTIALDNITPLRSLKGLTWLTSSDGTLPKDGMAFITADGNVSTIPSNNIMLASQRHAACLEMETLRNPQNRTDVITHPKDQTAWHITSSLVGWNQADATCKAEFGNDFVFSTPRNSFEHAILHQNRTETWINLELSHPSPDVLCLNTPLNGEMHNSCVSNNYPVATNTNNAFQIDYTNTILTFGYSFLIPHANHLLGNMYGKDTAWYMLKGLQWSSLLLSPTSSLVPYAVGQGVEYGLAKTGLVSPTTALHTGTVTTLILSAAKKTTYWGVAELLACSASAALGSYMGAKTSATYSVLADLRENDSQEINKGSMYR